MTKQDEEVINSVAHNAVIQLIDGVCGSGKSYRIKQYIAQNHKQKRFLIVVPTIKLLRQTEHDLIHSLGVEGVVALSSEDNICVGEELTNQLKPLSASRVIIITHKAAEAFGMKALYDKTLQRYLAGFVVVVDEVPNPIVSARVAVDVGINHPWLSYMAVEELRKNGGAWLVAQNRSRLISSHREREGSTEAVKNLIWCALAGFPVMKSPVGSKSDIYSAYAYSPLVEMAKYCEEFYLIASNVAKSPFVIVAEEWAGLESKLAPVELQPDQERNKIAASNVTCHAIFENRASLSSLAEGTVFVDACNAVIQTLGDGFIYASNANKRGAINYKFQSVSDSVFSGKGTRTAFVSHGLNIFGGVDVHGYSDEELKAQQVEEEKLDLYRKGFTKAVWLGVARLSKERIGNITELCRKLGGDAPAILDAIERFNSFESAYQFVMRTKLRSGSCSDQVDLVFIDYPTLEYFKETYALEARIGKVGMLKMTSKGDRTFHLVQQYKAQGYRQVDVCRLAKLSKSTVSKNWAPIQ